METKNAVINVVLCYLSSARHRLTDQAIVTVCLSFYNGEKISEAKELLFKLTRETVTRRGECKVNTLTTLAKMAAFSHRRCLLTSGRPGYSVTIALPLYEV